MHDEAEATATRSAYTWVRPLSNPERCLCMIRLGFEDGTVGIVDLEDRLWGPIFESLKDPAVFRAQLEMDDRPRRNV
jgi:hypothetical protein